uniref:GOLD domain-containing protein n=1 Tax=Spermophilus dauricus TaxID=99837 RepID=A0A8C9QQ38_SPEDA
MLLIQLFLIPLSVCQCFWWWQCLVPKPTEFLPCGRGMVLSRQYGSEGRFTFTSHTPGEHQICLHSNSTRMALFARGKLRVHLDIQVGEHANNYPEIAAKDKLTELQLRARQLLDQVEHIQKEQDYQRYGEERFRLTSESTKQRVLWWSIAQTVILILTGIWQMRHLKSFFEAKKLV